MFSEAGRMRWIEKKYGFALWILWTAWAALCGLGCGGGKTPDVEAIKQQLEPGTYALFVTNHGHFVVRLFTNRAPRTTANFIGLAEGTKPFIDPKTKQEVKRLYYDGMVFHRVVKDFVIQTGCPFGMGHGGPGYQFEDEFHPDLRHDRPGILSMANSGPNTNGSQFFVTLRATPELDDRHSVFGEVVMGMDVVRAIGDVPIYVKPMPRKDRPIQDVVLEKVLILRIGPR